MVPPWLSGALFALATATAACLLAWRSAVLERAEGRCFGLFSSRRALEECVGASVPWNLALLLAALAGCLAPAWARVLLAFTLYGAGLAYGLLMGCCAETDEFKGARHVGAALTMQTVASLMLLLLPPETWPSLRLPPLATLLDLGVPLPQLDDSAATALLGAAALAGWFWFRAFFYFRLQDSFPTWAAAFTLGLFAAVGQLVPFFVLAQGDVSSDGLPWVIHVAYALLLVASAPVTSTGLEPTAVLREAHLPVLKSRGVAAELYLWATDLLSRTNQYLDACAVVVAFALDSGLKRPLLAAFLGSFVLQPMLTATLATCCRPSQSEKSRDVEEELLEDNRILYREVLADEEGEDLVAESCGWWWLVLLSSAAGFSPQTLWPRGRAWAHFARLTTENLPQLALQALLASELRREDGAVAILYASMAVSLAMALRSLLGSARTAASAALALLRALCGCLRKAAGACCAGVAGFCCAPLVPQEQQA